MKQFKRNKKRQKKDWSTLSQSADALWDTFSQIARLVGGTYLVYTYLFVSVSHIQDVWQLAVGGALLIDFAIEAYRINHEARSTANNGSDSK